MIDMDTPPRALIRKISSISGLAEEHAESVAGLYMEEGIAWVDPLGGKPVCKRGALDCRAILNAFAATPSGIPLH